MLAHRLFDGGSSSLSISRPSLGPVVIAVARARLWSSFRWCSESPLLARCETKRQEKISCLLGSCRLFPGLPPSQLWCAHPFRLCSRRQPQSSPCEPTEARASAPSPARPSGGADKPLRLVSAARPSLCAGFSPLCPPHPCGCALLHGSEASPLCHPQSLPMKGLSNAWKPFLLHSSLPLVQVPSLFFCLCYFFFLFPYPSPGVVSCLLGGLTFSASVQWVFCRSSSTCRCISNVSVGRKVISMSYSSAIFSLPGTLY